MFICHLENKFSCVGMFLSLSLFPPNICCLASPKMDALRELRLISSNIKNKKSTAYIEIIPKFVVEKHVYDDRAIERKRMERENR